MASAKDILQMRLLKGMPVPQEVLDVADTTDGLTEELYRNSLIRNLERDFGAVPYWVPEEGIEYSKNPMVPTLDKILSVLNLSDDPENIKGGKKGWQKFLEGFSKNQKDWKETILKNPQLGELGWNTAYNLFKQATLDQMQRDIGEERRKVVDPTIGEAWKDSRFIDYPVSAFMGLFTPRSKKAFQEGRTPSGAEIFMDAFQNAAYATPIGGVGSAITRGLGPSFASKIIGTVGSNAVAPVAVSGLDAITGAKDYAGPADMAMDMIVGTGTNMGVNKILGPMVATAYNWGKTRGVVPQVIRDFLDGTASEKDMARDLIAEAERKVKAHFGETNAAYADKLRKGVPADRLTDEQLKDYLEILKFRDLMRDKETAKQFTEAWNNYRNQAKANAGYNPAGKPKKDVSDWDDLSTAQRQKRTVEEMVDNSLLGANLGKKYSGILDYLENGLNSRIEPQAALAMKNHPELIALAEKRTAKDILRAPDFWMDVAKSWGVNRAGDDAAAQRAFSRLGVDVRELRKNQDEERKNDKVKASASRILSNSGLSDESAEFLREIQANPSMAIYGHPDPEKRDRFNMWLIREGNDLLRGTPYVRPTWDVK
jgi:hypothetical protein